jgi:hypothetical protein
MRIQVCGERRWGNGSTKRVPTIFAHCPRGLCTRGDGPERLARINVVSGAEARRPLISAVYRPLENKRHFMLDEGVVPPGPDQLSGPADW